MALSHPQPDQTDTRAIVNAARTTLARLAAGPAPVGGAAALAGYAVSDIPLPVYSLGLDHLAGGGGLDGAEPVAWRVFVVDGRDEPVGVADVTPPAGGRPAHCLGYTRGPVVESSGRALSSAAAVPAADGEYEPRFLEIPGLNTTALWLRGTGGRADRLVPVGPVPRFLRGQDAYSPDEFLDRVRPPAAERLRHDDAPSGEARGS